MAWWNFSLTASANGTADATQNWSEGESPSSINDSARALLARSAEFRDLISGKLVTTGTGTALVLASGQNPVFGSTANMDGQMFGFVPNATNTGPVTLAVDGLTAKPIRSQTGASGNLGAGVLIAGTPYIVSYYDTAGEFILQGFTGQPFSVPLGAILPYTGTSAPNANFVLPFGQAISRTTYATYFALVGTAFGPGDGSTTFNVPDLRGRAIFGNDNMGGVNANRITTAGSGIDGQVLGASGGNQSLTIGQSDLPQVTLSVVGNLTSGGITVGDAKFDAQAVRADLASVNVLKSGSGSLGITASLNSTALTGSTSFINGNVTQTAMNKMPPAMIMVFILRVL